MSRYATSWDFTAETDEYLAETFEMFAAAVAKGNDVEFMKSGMVAIVNELHGRALLVNAARPQVPAVRQAAYGRKVCTAGVTTPDGVTECGAIAVATWGASYGGIVLEEARCLAHN